MYGHVLLQLSSASCQSTTMRRRVGAPLNFTAITTRRRLRRMCRFKAVGSLPSHHWVALLSVYCFNMCTGIKLFYQALQPCQLESSATDLKIVCYRLLACITHKRFFCKVYGVEGALLPDLSSVNSILLVATQVNSTKGCERPFF